jgi:hypothetical protein
VAHARGNNCAAALSLGAAPVQVAGVVLPPWWGDHITIELSDRRSKIDWTEFFASTFDGACYRTSALS